MNDFKLHEVITDINADIIEVIHWQRIRTQIEEELDRPQIVPFEADEILQDHYGDSPSSPRTFEIDGVEITSRVLHRQGIGQHDIKGADLLYEIAGRKIILVQYKRSQPKSGRVNFDIQQLEDLLKSCPDICMYKKRIRNPRPYPYRLHGFCGIWIRVSENGFASFVHACEVISLLKSRKSFHISELNSSISKTNFLVLFASCRIGALTHLDQIIISRDRATALLMENNHIIFDVNQSGFFS